LIETGSQISPPSLGVAAPTKPTSKDSDLL
jgi:hypothetical protein